MYILKRSSSAFATFLDSTDTIDFETSHDFIPDDTSIPDTLLASSSNPLPKWDNLKPQIISFDGFKSVN